MKQVLGVIMCAALCGCGTAGVDTLEMAKAFYAQQRTYSSLRIAGFSELTIRGSNITVETTAPLDTLSTYPRDPSTLEVGLDGAAKIAGITAAGIVGNTLAEGPQVVSQPAPVVVSPEVIRVSEP